MVEAHNSALELITPEMQNLFKSARKSAAISYKISENNSSFHVKVRTT